MNRKGDRSTGMKRLFNIRSPFFAPRGRRIVVTTVVLAWAAFELTTGNPGWAALFAAAGGWCFYEFFVIFDPDNYKDDDNG